MAVSEWQVRNAGRIKKCVPECEGCIRVRDDNTCLGWADPGYMWAGRDCPHYSTSAKEKAELSQFWE